MSGLTQVKSMPCTPKGTCVKSAESLSLPTTPGICRKIEPGAWSAGVVPGKLQTDMATYLNRSDEDSDANSKNVVAKAMEILNSFTKQNSVVPKELDNSTLSSGFNDLRIHSLPLSGERVTRRRLLFLNSDSPDSGQTKLNLDNYGMNPSEDSINLQDTNFSSEEFPLSNPSWINSEKYSSDSAIDDSVLRVDDHVTRLGGGTNGQSIRSPVGSEYFPVNDRNKISNDDAKFFNEIGCQLNSIMKLSRQYETLLNSKTDNSDCVALQQHLEDEQLKRKKCEEKLIQLEIKLLQAEKKACKNFEKLKAGGMLVSKLQTHCKTITSSWDKYYQKYGLEKVKITRELDRKTAALKTLQENEKILQKKIEEFSAANCELQKCKEEYNQQLDAMKTNLEQLKCSNGQLESERIKLAGEIQDQKRERDYLESSLSDVGSRGYWKGLK